MARTQGTRRKRSTANGTIGTTSDQDISQLSLVEDEEQKASSKRKKTKKKKSEDLAPQAIPAEDSPHALEPPPEKALNELRDLLKTLRRGVHELLDSLPDEQPLPGIDVHRMKESMAQAETFLDKPSFVVGFAGGFNAGKSMLINSLLNQHVLKDGAEPTTSTVTRITSCEEGEEQMVIHFFTRKQFDDLFDRYHEDFIYLYESTFGNRPQSSRNHHSDLLDDIKNLRERLEVEDWSDRVRSLDSFYDLIVAHINHQHLLSPHPVRETLSRKNLIYYTTKAENSVAPLVREVQLEIHHPMLAQGSELIDLPGLGSPDPRDEEITVAALKGDEETGKRECDAVVHVMDSTAPFRAGEDRLFQIYRKVWGESFAKRVFLVVSRWSKLELQSPEEMLVVGKTITRVSERYGVDRNKVFITDGRIGTQYEPLSPEEMEQERERERKQFAKIQPELEAYLLPSGQSLFEATVQVMIDGNVTALRDALQYYLAFYKEYLHLSDALRVLESQIRKIQQAASLHLPALEQLEDDEEHFLEECRSDIDRQLKDMRNRAREGLQNFLQELLQEEILPKDLSSFCDSLYQSASKRIEQQDPEALRQKLLTKQITTRGPLTNPIPWESFRFLLQQEVTRLDNELEEFCSTIVSQIIEKYGQFLYDEIGLRDSLDRAFGATPKCREFSQKFHGMLDQLGHDLRLVSRNLNRLFFYEYSDVYHRRDHLDALVEIREELEEQFHQEIDGTPGGARQLTRWLLRQKMDYHFRKLGVYLPLCFLQQLEEIHSSVVEAIEEASYPIRQGYLQRLENREIGFEIDRIRHRYRQIRASLEQLSVVKEQMTDARQKLQKIRPTA